MHAKIPAARFAILSGTAGWGVKFPDDLAESGVRVVERGLTFDTPWGPTDNWQVIEIDRAVTPDGKSRQVLNVFAHGWKLDAADHSVHRQVGWVMGQAGVRKVLADSTCGSLNRALQPRDFVIASDILDLGQTLFSTLPGRFQYMCRGAQLFCPSLGRTLEATARELWPKDLRVYGHPSRLVMAHTWGPRFETPAEARALQHLGCDAVNQSMAAEATVTREIGACFISASYVTNYVDGVLPEQWGALDSVHEDFGEIAARISLRTIALAEDSDECGCSAFRTARPRRYRVSAQSAGPAN